MNENSPRMPGTIDRLSYKDLAEIVKSLRELKKLTQGDIVEQAKVSIRTIKRMEKGGKPIRSYYLEDICKALGYELRQESVYTLTPSTPCRASHSL